MIAYFQHLSVLGVILGIHSPPQKMGFFGINYDYRMIKPPTLVTLTTIFCALSETIYFLPNIGASYVRRTSPSVFEGVARSRKRNSKKKARSTVSSTTCPLKTPRKHHVTIISWDMRYDRYGLRIPVTTSGITFWKT